MKLEGLVEAVHSRCSELRLNDDRILMCEYAKKKLTLTEADRIVCIGEIERLARPWYRVFDRKFRLAMLDEYWMTSSAMGVHSLEYKWNGVVIRCNTKDGDRNRVELSRRREPFEFIFECPYARFVVTNRARVRFQFSKDFVNIAPIIAVILWRFSFRLEESSRRA